MTHLHPPLDPATDRTLGSGAWSLVIYGDYECPYTRNAVEYADAVRERLGEDGVTVGYRHFPLRHKHPNAERAARAAESAALQGAFWAMHRQLFLHQRSLSDVLALARAVPGVDAAVFDAALDAPEVVARVQRDVDTGRAMGLDGTPRIFVNGALHQGFYDTETLLEELEFGAA